MNLQKNPRIKDYLVNALIGTVLAKDLTEQRNLLLEYMIDDLNVLEDEALMLQYITLVGELPTEETLETYFQNLEASQVAYTGESTESESLEKEGSNPSRV